MPEIRKLLDEFDDAVLERGEAYYYDGRVLDLVEVAPGKYSATVRGSEDYEVSVFLSDEEYAFDCDCPYWNTPYCKHVVAVLLAIENRQDDLKSPLRAENDRSESTLSKLSKEELVTLLRDIQIAFPNTTDWIKARIGPPEDAIKTYRRLIRQTAASYMRNGYISYRDINAALCGAEEALSCLESMIYTSDIMHTFDFGMMVIEETIAIMQEGDDSGESGGIIEGCLDSLDQLFHQRILFETPESRKNYFDRLMTAVDSRVLHGWDSWRESLIDQCMQIADALPELRERLLQYYLRIIDSTDGVGQYSRDYEREQAQKSYYAMLLRWNDEDAAQAFAAAHMENDYFRIQFFESALHREQYDQAVNICLAAEQACASYRGLRHEWRKRRYDVYAKIDDTEAQKQLAEEMLLEGYGE